MKKRNIWLFGILFTLLFVGFILAVANEFYAQNPADIGTFNIFGKVLNITYNISDAALVFSTIRLYYKTNGTTDNFFYFLNGSAISGFNSRNYSSNSTNLFSFSLYDNQIYPATYNYNESLMENTAHLTYNLNDNDIYIKIRMFNVSNLKNYSLFEVYADNQTAASNTLRIYYCNSSYTTGNPAGSNLCTNFYNLPASELFNHTHTVNSKHHLVPFPINTSGYIGNVPVTSTSYFLLRGRNGVNAWNIFYISPVSRADTIQADINGGTGTTWTNLAGTVDSHLHQYDGTESFWYYACADGTDAPTQNCTSVTKDLIELGGIGPSSVGIYSPSNQSYRRNIPINYTAAASPNGYAIAAGYNISLYNYSDNFVSLINENNSLNLSFIWDSTGTPDGLYNIHVWGCDVNELCALGESEDFTLDNTNPASILTCAPSTVNIGESVTCSCSSGDATSGVAATIFTEHPSTSAAGTFSTICNVTDYAGNSATDTFDYTVTYGGTYSGGSGGGGGSSGRNPQAQPSAQPPAQPATPVTPGTSVPKTENEVVDVIVEDDTYKLNILEVGENSVKTIFSYDGIEREMKVGEEITYEIKENIVTIKLEGIGEQGAVFNVLSRRKFPINYQKIAIILGLAALIILSLVFFMKYKKKIKKKRKNKRR